MKTIKKIALLVTVCLINFTFGAYAQKGHPHHPHRGKAAHPHHPHKGAVVRVSPFRPHKVVVYHPHWGKRYAFNHRWVFFPKYNFYWDNWREMYVYRNGAVWVSNVMAPPAIVNINIENEKHYELKETEDDNDNIQDLNDTHQKEYKPE